MATEETTSNMQQNSPAQGAAPAGSHSRADAQLVNDSRANVGSELNAEYGDAADPTSEKLGIGGRGDASPLNTNTK